MKIYFKKLQCGPHFLNSTRDQSLKGFIYDVMQRDCKSFMKAMLSKIRALANQYIYNATSKE